jgi:hypothetical protein
MDVADQAAALIALRLALGRCGLDRAAQESVIAIGGMVHVAMFGMLAAADIARICKVMHTRAIDPIMITVMQEQLLQGMRFWVTNRQRLGLPVEAEDFTTATAFTQTALMMQMAEDKARTEKDQIAMMPEEFKKASEYKLFEESFEAYLGLLKGTGRIPLSYVMP